MKKKWMKWAVWILLVPVLLFVALMVLLYVPPVQNFIRKKATAIASEATGMEISVGRIDLRFPLNLLVSDVQVVQQPDTLLALENLNVHVQAWPLLRGQVEIDEIALNGVEVNSAGLLEGLQVKGTLGSFYLASHGVDLVNESVVLNDVRLDDTRVQVLLADTTATEEETSAALKWKIVLHTLGLKNVSVDVEMPLDTLRLSARVGETLLQEAEADLGRQRYGWQHFRLSDTSVAVDAGNGTPANGFDASHIALRNISMEIDSVFYCGRDLNAVIRQCAMAERSGLNITAFTGKLSADSTVIRLPSLLLRTPHSQIELSAQTYWELLDVPTTGNLAARLDAFIGKQDVMLFAGDLPEAFKESYPFRPLMVHAGTKGNLKQMQLSRFSVDLPGAFSLNGIGELYNLADSLTRRGTLDVEMQTKEVNFLTALADMSPDGGVILPDSMDLNAHLDIEGTRYEAHLELKEGNGKLLADGFYDTSAETYQADLQIDSLQVEHFLPHDSIYTLSARLKAKGKGTDLVSPQTTSVASLSLKQLQYGQWDFSGIDLKAGLKEARAAVRLTSDNPLVMMRGEADMRLDRTYLDGKLAMDVERLDLYRLGVAPRELERPFAFQLGAEARRDSIKLSLDAGDLDFRFRARSTLKQLMEQSEQFMTVLTQQIAERHLDHAALRQVLPTAGMHLQSGNKNPLSAYLATKDITYNDFKLSFGFTPEVGINGRTALNGLRVDSLQIDTVFFAIRQDTTRMTLQGGVVNGPKNPQFVFRTTLTGEIRSEDAGLTLNYVDGDGQTGVLFGIDARPLTEGNGRGNGVLLQLSPAQPVIAYHKFHFVDDARWIYLHNDMRVYADVNMESDEGMRFRMQSNQQDTVSLQNMNVELSRFRLDELSDVLPYMPRLTGLFTLEANYIQTPASLQLSAESMVEQLTYEGLPVGDIGLGATWLPDGENRHYLNGYVSLNNEEVLSADGLLEQRGGTEAMDVQAAVTRFPLSIANAFVPDRMVSLTGALNGELALSGTSENVRMDGQLAMDSVSVYARQAGARFWLDNRPVRIDNNRLLFDRFAIYTTSNNPFTIDGNVDFRNMEHPTADLSLKAGNYTLLDARRTRESMVYGKVCVDVAATVRGPLDALVMRGYMNLLGDTNVTYVLTDSPLTVEDRLDGLVSFVSFSDTTGVAVNEVPAMSLGGLDMLMTVNIDDAVRLRADLTTDGSKYVELEGGGNLSLQYTPQGVMTLNGRYTLTGGVMKYSLPVIPLKEFQFTDGSYVDWRGDMMNPTLNLKATERMRASVPDGDDGATRMVNFDLSISIRNRLESPELVFDISAPEDATIENELLAMGAEERSKQAITMMATGIYLNGNGKGAGLTMGSALNSVIQSQINALAGSVKNASISVGIEDRTAAETGDTQKDISFRYSQRLFNDRVQIVIGGKVSTGANATNDVESFIDNISLEYRLDKSATRYVRVFHNKNYESVLDGEITETGAGLILRKKMDRLSELFIFRRRKQTEEDL